MDTQKVTVKDLFNAPVHYIVPHFQRFYVWDLDIQWEPLWQDITDTALDILDRWSNCEDKLAAVSDMSPHFMGAVVLKQKQTPPGQPTERIVVDGQQRFTTLQIVLVALASSLAELDEASELQQHVTTIKTLTENPTSMGGRGHFKYKIRPFGQDFVVFRQLVDGYGNGTDDHVMMNCHHTFKKWVNSWLQQGPQDVETRAIALITTIFDLILIVSLNLEHNEDEYLIFETMNARAEPLAEWDKAKNHFLSKSRNTEIGEDNFYTQFIDRFDSEKWWSQDASQPRFQGNRIGLFLNYWLRVRLCNKVPERRTYYHFRKHVRDEQDVIGVARSFQEYATSFQEIEQQPDDDGTVQGRFKYRRTVLGAGVVVPLMMKLRNLLGTGEAFDRCARVIESYLVRRQINGWSTRSYTDLFLSLLRKVSQSSDSQRVVGVLVNFLANNWWPDDRQIREAVSTRTVYPGVAQKRLKMIFRAIEGHLISEMASNKNVPDDRDLWIEHVMPQSWQRHYPLPSDASQDAELQRERAISRLGNLTLTNYKLDIKLSNRPWREKRRMLRDHDNLFLNKDLLDHAPEDRWDENTIRERDGRLADIICTIWPHDDALKSEFGVE